MIIFALSEPQINRSTYSIGTGRIKLMINIQIKQVLSLHNMCKDYSVNMLAIKGDMRSPELCLSTLMTNRFLGIFYCLGNKRVKRIRNGKEKGEES